MPRLGWLAPAIAILCAAAALPSGAQPDQAPTGPAGDRPPREIFTPAPVYPEGTATDIGTGSVVIRFIVDKTGTPTEPEIVSSTNPVFNDGALETIRKWRYSPALQDGRPVPARMDQTLIFERNGDTENVPYSVGPPAGNPADYKPAQVLSLLPVIYPYTLGRDGVTGRASATLQIDALGHVTGVKIVSCTKPEFGLAVAAAVQGFEFSPAMANGKPVEAVMGFSQQFDSHAPSDPDASRLFDIEGVPGAVSTISQLDTRPIPLSAPTPKYPRAMLDGDVPGDAEVEFLIEEDGTVDLPRIVRASSQEFGYAAVQAVASWRFEPPMLHGTATIARARVPMRFLPGKDQAALSVVDAPEPVHVPATGGVPEALPAPAAADAADQDLLGDADTPIRPVFRPAPVYPARMNQYHVSGDVVVEFVVDKSGNAINPVVLHSSNPAFDESAINAVLRWKFKPATKNGKPVNKEATQDIRFEPADSPTPLMQFDVTPATRDEPGTSRPVVTGTYPIVYPYELERTNVTGRAKARMLLSETGRVISVKIVSCSQPEFGFALAAAVQGFRYSPAQKDGIPVPSIMEMDQVFDSEQLSAPETRRLFFMDQHKGAVHVVAELDAPPHPLSIRRPLYPSALLGTGITGDASVEFLIQEDGWVRLPRIVQASRPEFGYAAVEAVASWAFEPPRVHGKPVVARARVSFKFKPKPSEAAAH